MECLNKKLEIISIFKFITQFKLHHLQRVNQPEVKKYLTFSPIDVI